MASIFSFIKNPKLAGDLASNLVKDELGTLATKGKRYIPGVAMIVGALVLALGAGILLVLSLLEVLTFMMPFWLAALVLAISLGLVAFGLITQAKASIAQAAEAEPEELVG